MVYVANAFSVGMLDGDAILRVKKVSIEKAREILTHNDFVSAVGHESTAKVMSELLQINIPFNRIQIRLNRGDRLLLFQLLERLPEGAVLSKEEVMRIPHQFFVIDVI